MEQLKEEIWEMFNNKEFNNNGYLTGYNKAIKDVSNLIDAKIKQKESEKLQTYIIKKKK